MLLCHDYSLQEVSRVTSFDCLLFRRIAPHEEYPHKRRY